MAPLSSLSGDSSPDSRLERLLVHTLLRRGRATNLLLVVAYAAAVVGLGVSLFADASGRTAGIALLFVAFACLFVASLRIVDATRADTDAGRPSRGR